MPDAAVRRRRQAGQLALPERTAKLFGELRRQGFEKRCVDLLAVGLLQHESHQALTGHPVHRQQALRWQLPPQRRFEYLGGPRQDPIEHLPAVERFDDVEVQQLEVKHAELTPPVELRTQPVEVNGKRR